MGCFSYMCLNSDKPVLSTSFSGSPVYLFLLKGGEVIEEMYGNYDSYGRVFTTELDTSVKHELYKSFKWNMPRGQVVDLKFNSNPGDGIAAILAEHYDGVKPTEQSSDDPNQGWGESAELLEETGEGGYKRVEKPYHKVYPENLFTVKKALPSSGNSGHGYKSYYDVIYQGHRDTDYNLTYRKPNSTWQSTRKDAEAFIKGTINVEKLISEKILDNNDYEDYSSRRIVRMYLKFLDSWASGLDIRSSWTEDQVADRVLNSYHTSAKEAEEFNNKTYFRFVNKEKYEEKKDAIRDFNKYKENIALYQLSPLPIDSFYLDMFPEDRPPVKDGSVGDLLQKSRDLLEKLGKD